MPSTFNVTQKQHQPEMSEAKFHNFAQSM